MKILIVPDSFKGSLTARQAGEAMRRGAEAGGHTAEVVPMSDGGEGFCSCFAELCRAEKIRVKTLDTYLQDIDADYCRRGETAVIESAAASGICARRDVLNSTSYGTGMLIGHAVKHGCRKIILGLGGTGCSDGGLGALYALGVRFYGKKMPQSIPISRDMALVETIGAGTALMKMQNVQLLFATDVTAPYCGPKGAAYVFAPQKGASKKEVPMLDQGLAHLGRLLQTVSGNNVNDCPGAGAAGGLCGGLWGVFGGKIESGFSILSREAGLAEKIRQSDLIVTGEGKTDAQTRMGKLPWRIWQMCQAAGKPCWLLSGQIDGEAFGDRAASLCEPGGDCAFAIEHAGELLENKMIKLLQSKPNLL